jgi:hypothetical protein
VYDLSPEEFDIKFPNGLLAFNIEPEADKFSLCCRVYLQSPKQLKKVVAENWAR